jgi:hypothetical protein
MHASCFIKLDLDGNILFNPTDLASTRRASSSTRRSIARATTSIA